MREEELEAHGYNKRDAGIHQNCLKAHTHSEAGLTSLMLSSGRRSINMACRCCWRSPGAEKGRKEEWRNRTGSPHSPHSFRIYLLGLSLQINILPSGFLESNSMLRWENMETGVPVVQQNCILEGKQHWGLKASQLKILPGFDRSHSGSIRTAQQQHFCYQTAAISK